MSFTVDILRYTDPDRKNLAHAAAVYLGKDDVDNIKRPIGIMKKRHALAIFRGESVRFEFQTSKVIYDHLITYTTADMRACAGLRANKAFEFVPPSEDDDPVYVAIATQSLEAYHKLIQGIDPLTEEPSKRKRLQAARSILPMGMKIRYEFQFNFVTLITIFQQRIWTPGAQQDTFEVVHDMWIKVRDMDPELWDAVHDMFGPEEIGWQHARDKIKKKDPELYQTIISTYGGIKTMWD